MNKILKLGLSFFSNSNKDKEEEKLISNEELTFIIEKTIKSTDSIIFIKAQHWIESDILEADKEIFNSFVETMEENGMKVEFSAGSYQITRTIKNTNGTVCSILKNFKYKEKQ